MHRFKLHRAELSLAVVAAVSFFAASQQGLFDAPTLGSVVDAPGIEWLPKPIDLPTVQLATDTGGSWSTDKLEGQFHFLFFGYTRCPDVCPTTLGALSSAQDKISKAGVEPPTTLFVSVDFESDGREQLTEYVQHFGTRVLGLSGTESAVRALASRVGAGFRNDPSASANRDIQHSTAVFLLDRTGSMIARLPAPHSPSALSEALTPFLLEQSTTQTTEVSL